jgi:cytochrome c-type biogenesis protein CcmH
MKKLKRSYSFLIIVSVLVFTGNAPAEDELTQAQKQLQADIEHSLIAPCCWNMTLDHHDSPAARKVKQEVKQMVLAGKNKQEILAYFSSQPQYGERILATPAQDNLLGKLAYWLIPVAFLIGAIAIFATVKRLSGKKQTDKQETPQQTAAPDSDPKKPDQSWQDRVESELKELD